MRSQRLWVVWMLGALALGGCSCDGGGLGSTTAGFRTATTEIDFGKALEGTSIVRTVELTATGRSDVVVDVATEGPFSAPSPVELPGGATSKLDVTFTAGTGEANGKLILSSHGESFEVALRGVGIHPLDCQPSVSCRESHFSLESESCEETVAADGTGCTPSDLPLKMRAAFTDFTLNAGGGAFCRSSIARLANVGDLVGACQQLPRWIYAGGHVLPGLVRRRAEERELCVAGALGR